MGSYQELNCESDDSNEQYDLDYIHSCKGISYFKKDNGHLTKHVLSLNKQITPITVPHGPELARWFSFVVLQILLSITRKVSWYPLYAQV